MNFTAAGLSDVGLQREHNEDSFCILSEHRLFVVADGMGGHRAGDIASRMATAEIKTFFDAATLGDDGQWHRLSDAVDRSAARRREADQEPHAPNLPSAECL